MTSPCSTSPSTASCGVATWWPCDVDDVLLSGRVSAPYDYHPEEDRPARAVRDHGADPRDGHAVDHQEWPSTWRLPVPEPDQEEQAPDHPALCAVDGWLDHLDRPSTRYSYGTHSLRRTKVALIYRRTGNLRAVQLLLGHTKRRARSDISASRWTTRSPSPSRWTSDRHGGGEQPPPILCRL